MKVKLLYETHHRLRHQNRMNPVDRFVDAQYRNRLPNQQAHHLFVDTCLNKKSLIPRNLQTKKYNGGLATSPTIQFSEDGSIFACGDCSDFVQLWDVSKILVSRDMPNPVMFKYPDEVDCISLSPDKSHIFASCPNSQQIYIYDIFRYAINLCIYFAHIDCQLIFFHNFHFFFFKYIFYFLEGNVSTSRLLSLRLLYAPTVIGIFW